MTRFTAMAFAVFVALPWSHSAHAGLVAYSNRGDFLAASTAMTTVDFEGILLPGEPSRQIQPPVLGLSGVEFTAGTSEILVSSSSAITTRAPMSCPHSKTLVKCPTPS